MPSTNSSKKKRSPKNSSMPGLVFNEVLLNQPVTEEAAFVSKPKKKKLYRVRTPKTPYFKQNPNPSRPPSLQTKKTTDHTASLLWLGVGTSLLIILVVLSWSFKVQFGFLNWGNTSEKKLFDKTTDSWKNAFTAAASESDLQNQINKLEVADTLRDMITNSTTPEKNTFLSTTTVTSTI